MRKPAAWVMVLSGLVISVSCGEEDADTVKESTGEGTERYDYVGKYVCEDIGCVVEVSESKGLCTVTLICHDVWETDHPIKRHSVDGLLDAENSFETSVDFEKSVHIQGWTTVLVTP